MLVPFFHWRKPDGSYTLEVKPAFEDFPSNDAVTNTARVMAAIEAMARAQHSGCHHKI